MNKNNLNWADNKVFNNPSNTQNMRPYTETMPIQYQDAIKNPASLSPSTYQEPITQKPAAPMTGFTPSDFQEPVAAAPLQQGMQPMMTPGTGTQPYSMQGAETQPMPSPGIGMPGIQTSPSQGMGMPGTLTRDTSFAPNPFFNVPGPPSVMDPGYIPAYLRSQIGKRVRAEFVLGSNLYTDRTGILRDVGYNYFILEDTITHAMVMCDLYSVKFLTSL